MLTSLDYNAKPPAMLEALELAYGDVRDELATWQQFYNARQNKHESLVSWFNRLQELLREAAEGEPVSNEKKTKLLKSQLWTHLHDSTLKGASRHKFDDSTVTTNDLFKYLRHYNETNELVQPMAKVMLTTPEADPVHKLTEQVAEIRDMVLQMQKEAALQREASNNRTTGVGVSFNLCFRCGQSGHKARNCWANQSGPRLTTPQRFHNQGWRHQQPWRQPMPQAYGYTPNAPYVPHQPDVQMGPATGTAQPWRYGRADNPGN